MKNDWLIARLSTVVFTCCIGASCSDERQTDTRFDRNKGLFSTLQEAEQLTVYEGLPHQRDERKVWEEEKSKKPTVELHGFLFYRDLLALKPDDAKKLKALLEDETSFTPFGGVKKCGGFHPDYCVQWTVGEKTYRCLVCLGCWEVKVYGPNAELYCDLKHEVRTQLKELFKPYRKNRPASDE
jgi:hypothetical protein